MSDSLKVYRNHLVDQNRQDIQEHIRAILRLIGEDVDREGLQDTPARVARMYEEIFAGYSLNPAGGAGRHLR